MGQPTQADLDACRELGAVLAAGIALDATSLAARDRDRLAGEGSARRTAASPTVAAEPEPTTSRKSMTATEPVRLTRVLTRRGLRVQALAGRSAHRARARARHRPRRRPDLLVGFDTADDAAVYRLRDDLAVVVTTDFFTPIVDDPFDWGRIAATNALSDVYAMGGTPLLALNLVAWPRETLPFELLARVLDGGADVVRAAGALIAGGHSIDDAEPKYGLAVVGTVHPDRVLHERRRPGRRRARAHEADRTRRDLDGREARRGDARASSQSAVEVMTTLNAGARDAALERRRRRPRRRPTSRASA